MTSRIPTLNRGVDVYSLPLSTKEGFVLSRVDDVSSVEDIAIMVGLKVDELMTVLDRLADVGAVELSWRPAKQAPNEPASKAPSSADAEPTPGLKGEAHPAVQRALAPPPIQPYTEGELDERSDLNEVQKRRVLVAFYGLEDKNYYELLGVDMDADRKLIRSAYFELSRLFHPDSMFGRELGSFRVKMETVFTRLTEAYEVLGRAQRRKEYDDYLASTMTTSALQNGFDRVERKVRALSTAPPQPPSQTPASPSASPTSSVASTPAPSSVSSTPARASARPPAATGSGRPAEPRSPSSSAQRAPISVEERKAQARERLRRSFAGTSQVGRSTLTGGTSRGSTSSQPATASPSNRAQPRASAVGASAMGVGAGVQAVLSHLRRAKDAEAAGDLLSAAAALQAALALQPEHKDLQEQYARVSSAVTRKLADNYEKQARYEEKQAKWAAAALSWERVSDGRPESDSAARAVAEALLKASGDLQKAQRYAQRAVDLTPQDPANVVVLVRVLTAAGMRSQARRELEKAVKLDPHNAMIKDLLAEVR